MVEEPLSNRFYTASHARKLSLGSGASYSSRKTRATEGHEASRSLLKSLEDELKRISMRSTSSYRSMLSGSLRKHSDIIVNKSKASLTFSSDSLSFS